MGSNSIMSQTIEKILSMKQYSTALEIVDRELSNIIAVSPERRKWIALRVYCHMKLKNYVIAAADLDMLPPLPSYVLHFSTSRESLSSTIESSLLGIRCSFYDFVLKFMAAVFSLHIVNVNAHESLNSRTEFAELNKIHYLNPLYAFIRWVEMCTKVCEEKKNQNLEDTELQSLYRKPTSPTLVQLSRALETWTVRRMLAIQCLVNCLIQLGLYEEAVSCVNRDILKDHPESVIGLIMVGRIRLSQGHLRAAEYYFGVAECLSHENEFRTFMATANSIIQLAQFEVSCAIKELEDVMDLPSISDVSSDFLSSSHPNVQIQRRLQHQEACIALNNLAVSLVYRGGVTNSVYVLEELFLATDSPFMFFAGLKNLIALYEFSFNSKPKINRLKAQIQAYTSEDPQFSTLVSMV